jgi:hypothetical protein
MRQKRMAKGKGRGSAKCPLETKLEREFRD